MRFGWIERGDVFIIIYRWACNGFLVVSGAFCVLVRWMWCDVL